MKSLHSIWSRRFGEYIAEMQKYMQVMFTGHFAFAVVFTVGALGYQYSEWLKVVDLSFPAAIVVSIIIAASLQFGSLITLLKEPDAVFFLPMEQQMYDYMKRVKNWSIFVQLPIPLVLLFVSLPLLTKVENLSVVGIVSAALVIVAFKRYIVEQRIVFYWKREKSLLLEMMYGFVLSGFTLFYILQENYLYAMPFVIATYVIERRNKIEEILPFPYEKMVELENNRKLRFYRLANYFTDVPHIRATVKERAWLKPVLSIIPYSQRNAEVYLLARKFIRSSEMFGLWGRLTLLIALCYAFVDMPLVQLIVGAVLVFSSAIQLRIALEKQDDFKMEQLFPFYSKRSQLVAVQKVVRVAQYVQVILTAIVGAVTTIEWNNALFIILLQIVVIEVVIRYSRK